jgi:hypothetical protein
LLKVHQRKGRGKEPNLPKPLINKQQEGQQWVGERLLPEAGQEQRQQTKGPSPWAPTVRQLCSIEEQTANHHNMLTGKPVDGSLTLPLLQGKGGGKDTSLP